MWKVINSIVRKETKNNDEITFLGNDNNQKIRYSNKIANIMNTHYCNGSVELTRNINKPINLSLSLPKMNPKSIHSFPIHKNQVKTGINQMKLKSGSI